MCIVYLLYSVLCFFFFKQKTAYEMRISDWSSDVCSSDLSAGSDPWPFGPPATPLREGNGFGAFSADGHEYVIDLAPGQATPAPWSNVLANPRFGCVVSESNAGYTWAENAHEFRLTPWHDDPVSDPGGEAFYIRDEQTGRFWSPTPLPSAGDGAYRVRHGLDRKSTRLNSSH